MLALSANAQSFSESAVNFAKDRGVKRRRWGLAVWAGPESILTHRVDHLFSRHRLVGTRQQCGGGAEAGHFLCLRFRAWLGFGALR
jgi:hypothetical protein